MTVINASIFVQFVEPLISSSHIQSAARPFLDDERWKPSWYAVEGGAQKSPFRVERLIPPLDVPDDVPDSVLVSDTYCEFGAERPHRSYHAFVDFSAVPSIAVETSEPLTGESIAQWLALADEIVRSRATRFAAVYLRLGEQTDSTYHRCATIATGHIRLFGAYTLGIRTYFSSPYYGAQIPDIPCAQRTELPDAALVMLDLHDPLKARSFGDIEACFEQALRRLRTAGILAEPSADGHPTTPARHKMDAHAAITVGDLRRIAGNADA